MIQGIMISRFAKLWVQSSGMIRRWGVWRGVWRGVSGGVWAGLALLCGACAAGQDTHMLAAGQNSAPQSAPGPSNPPNILIIVTDDQGYGDFGFTGNPVLKTPAIDQLAAQGRSFDRFYVSPVCAPTRASLLTGRNALRTGVFFATRNGEALAADEVTIAEAFKASGYRTGAFGKWHNGAHFPEHPLGQGFDTFFGFAAGHLTFYFNALLERDGEAVRTTGYVADVITSGAIDFIQEASSEPFLAYVALNTPHSPFELPARYYRPYKSRGLDDLSASVYGMVANIDDNVARLLTALETSGQRDNTIIVYLSDNGPAFPHGNTRFNAGLRGAKGSLDEGGVRVPLIVHWPGHIEGGEVISDLSQHIDVFPTLAALAGVDIAQAEALDGLDKSDIWLGKAAERRSDRFIFHNRSKNPKLAMKVDVSAHPGAVRSQRWAAISDAQGRWSLYDIENDPAQLIDLAAQHSQTLADMTAAYETWFAQARREGVPHFRPIVIGTGFQDVDTLAAHEGHIFPPGIGYAHGAGWAHDWISDWTDPRARALWPLKIAAGGTYEISISYQWPYSDKAGVELVGKIQGQMFAQTFAPTAHTPIPGRRYYETGEASARAWTRARAGKVELSKGLAELELQLGRQSAGLELKAVHLRRLPEDSAQADEAGASRAKETAFVQP